MRASIRDIGPAFGALWNIVGSCFDPAHAGAHRKWTLVDAVQPQWSRQLRGLEVPVTHLLELIDELKKKMRDLYGKVAALRVAVRFVRESEATGQELLFNPTEILK